MYLFTYHISTNICFEKMVEAPGYFSLKITLSLLVFELDQILKLHFIDLMAVNLVKKNGVTLFLALVVIWKYFFCKNGGGAGIIPYANNYVLVVF
jgi:hypothetical protein